MKMPELFVFAESFILGFVAAEVFRVTFYLSGGFAQALNDLSPWTIVVLLFFGLFVLVTYAIQRGALSTAMRMFRSRRIDQLMMVGLGVWSNELALALPWLSKLHTKLKVADPYWGLVLLILLCVVLSTPIIQRLRSRPEKKPSQLLYLSDEEITLDEHDLLGNKELAQTFAKTVLESGAHAGLVFGIDGPWGVGKTSFINLAERYWAQEMHRIIVCRFEPLRYASEPDLADRMLRDVTAKIQSKVYAPEFKSAANRYSRWIKGTADFSFLGFKLSMEPSQQTVDELLDDIDEVLKRLGRRLIIVIDDLDRLDPKTANNVLFAIRRTYKLNQATYVLCYDTEILVNNQDEGSKAREFLEKFVTVKLSLFVDSSSIRKFLLADWKRVESKVASVPSDTMINLGAVVKELASILESDQAAKYLPLIGDMRKVKRFINAIVLLPLEESILGRTDFNKQDLINLMLLQYNYPGLFRRIYAAETDGRSGSFSVKREYGKSELFNDTNFAQLIKSEGTAGFLLQQLFDVEELSLKDWGAIDETTKRSRACFNFEGLRNLESYLKFIVRLEKPIPQQTFVLYQGAVEQVLRGKHIVEVLTSPDFNLVQQEGEDCHHQFWSTLVNQSRDFTSELADQAIDRLIEYLPRYSAFDNDDRGLRQRSIYSLLRLLDRAGWGRTDGGRMQNTPQNVVEIAWRIFGKGTYQERGLLERLASPQRGALAWNDLMLFRLQCSADRQGQLYNLHTALIFDQDETAARTGLVTNLARLGMRKLSQETFSLFKRTYIDQKRNFLAEVNQVPVRDFLGEAFAGLEQNASFDQPSDIKERSIAHKIASARSVIKSFVIYQLSNSLPPNGSGVGCGYYDEQGVNDGGAIAKLMNIYVFDTCFNPDVDENNALLFLDHCLSHLSSSFFSDRDDRIYSATKNEIPGGLDQMAMGRYWQQHCAHIRAIGFQAIDRTVLTPNYTAFYREDLNGVFDVLDQMADEADKS